MVFDTFSDFYPAYLSAHQNVTCRRLHFVGTSGVIATLLLFFFTGAISLLLLLPLLGYGFAWSGHYIYEKNSPLSLKYPLYSMMGDFKMFWDIMCGRVAAF